jgi:mono/diheme cytochrome c family protein
MTLVVCAAIAAALTRVETSSPSPSQPTLAAAPASRAMLDTYCVTCHNQRTKTAGLALDAVDVTTPQTNPEVWERVITRLRAGSMPPAGRPRPDAATSHAVVAWLEADIDRAWTARPTPGRVNAVHRLNRTEYSNAVRDLFALDPLAFDVKSLLPGDETADGSFDNFADVLTISTAHLERYLSTPSRFRCTWSRTIARTTSCRSVRAAASRFTTSSRSMASI